MVVPLLNIPIISVVLLLLAGILIGHLIWYRDRTDDEAMLADLRSENSDMQQALHEHKHAYVELEAQFEDRKKTFDQLKAANFQLEQAQSVKQQDLSEIHNELARLQQLKDQAFHDLDQERQQRRALQEALTAAEDNTVRANGLTDQLQSQLNVLQLHQGTLDTNSEAEEELREDLRQAKSDFDAIKRERDALVHRLQEGKEDVQLITELQEQLQQKQEAWREKNEEVKTLTSELADAKAGKEELEESASRATTELRQREEELGSLRKERDEAKEQVEDARDLQEQLEQQLQSVEQLLAQRDEAIEKATSNEKQFLEAQVRIDALSEKLEGHTHESHVMQNSHEEAKLELKQENDALRQKLADLNREHEAVSQVLIDERSRLSSMESENHRLTVFAQEADDSAAKTNEELRTNLARKQVELDTLRTELEDIASQLSRERHQREHLQTVLHDRNTDDAKVAEERKSFELKLTSLETKNESLLGQAAELLTLRGVHAAAQEQILALTGEVQQSRQESDDERIAMSNRIDELNRQTSQLTSQLAQLRVEREDQITELERLQQAHRSALVGRQELESTKDDLAQEVRQLQTDLDQAGELEQRNRQLEQRVEKMQSELVVAQSTESQLSELENQIAKLQQELNSAREMETVVVDLKTRLDRVIAQRDEAMQAQAEKLETIEDLRKRIVQSEEDYAALRERFDDLQHGEAEAEELRQGFLQLQLQANESADRLRRVTVERDSQKDALSNAEDRLTRLESRAKANEDTIRNLRRERAAVLSSRQPATVSYSSLAGSVPEKDSGGRMRRDDVLGMVYTQPPKRKDDLKRISGIAQVLEKKLNAFGVYTYRQVMDWDEVAIAEFSKLLSFRDRIERDDWIGQARNLQYETYGRAA